MYSLGKTKYLILLWPWWGHFSSLPIPPRPSPSLPSPPPSPSLPHSLLPSLVYLYRRVRTTSEYLWHISVSVCNLSVCLPVLRCFQAVRSLSLSLSTRKPLLCCYQHRGLLSYHWDELYIYLRTIYLFCFITVYNHFITIQRRPTLSV